MDGRGLSGGNRRVGWAQLHSGGVLHRVLAGFYLEGRVAGFDEPDVGTWLGFSRPMGGWSPATDAAGPEERESNHQQDGSNDDRGVVHGEEGPKSERSHQGDVDPGKHDAKSAGAAESRGWEPLGPGLSLARFLGQRGAALFAEHVDTSLPGDLAPY